MPIPCVYVVIDKTSSDYKWIRHIEEDLDPYVTYTGQAPWLLLRNFHS